MLRSWASEDLESAHAYQSDPEVWRYIGDPSRTLDDTRERLERYSGWEREHGYTLWAVVERRAASWWAIAASSRSRARVLRWSSATASRRAHWGIGYATEAAVAVRDLGFGRFALERIYVDVDPGNAASQNVARKLGPSEVRPATHKGDPVLRFVLERPG